jgi:two-component system response regulator AtoC
MDQTIGLIEPDKRLSEFIRSFLAEYFIVRSFNNVKECLNAMKSYQVSLILVRYRQEVSDGIELFRIVRDKFPRILRIMILEDGVKPDGKDYKIPVIHMGQLNTCGPSLIKKYFDEQLLNQPEFEVIKNDAPFIIGSHPMLMEQFKSALKIARFSECALITGETGTGKELIARFIHYRGIRRNGPFHVVNCAAVNNSLFESEFFGHKKGAYTGALENSSGHFLKAQDGTLVLDEISEIDPTSQAKLLRAIENQEIYAVGSQKLSKINVRVLAISNKWLPNLVNQGKFRQDLYYRLNILHIRLPALRERADDIDGLAKYFIRCFCMKYKISGSLKIDPAIYPYLRKQQFRGNVRELENLIYKIMVIKRAGSDRITLNDFKSYFEEQQLSGIQSEYLNSSRAETDKSEKARIMACLRECSFNISLAARKMGISRQNLQYRMKKYNIRRKGQK